MDSKFIVKLYMIYVVATFIFFFCKENKCKSFLQHLRKENIYHTLIYLHIEYIPVAPFQNAFAPSSA